MISAATVARRVRPAIGGLVHDDILDPQATLCSFGETKTNLLYHEDEP